MMVTYATLPEGELGRTTVRRTDSLDCSTNPTINEWMHTAMLTALMAEVADAVGEEGDAILIAAVHRVLQIVAPNPN